MSPLALLAWIGLGLFILGYLVKEAIQWTLVLRALMEKEKTGAEAMPGRSAVVARSFRLPPGGGTARGKVRLHGEIWDAGLEPPGDGISLPHEGDEVVVTRVQGLRLHVRPGAGSSGDEHTL